NRAGPPLAIGAGMTRLAILSLLALPLLVACGAAADGSTGHDDAESTTPSRSQDAIVGGKAATGYPEAALIDMYENGQVFAACSGTVIAPQVVLTAGHCIIGVGSWVVRTPYAGNQTASAKSGATLDYKSTEEYVDAKA